MNTAELMLFGVMTFAGISFGWFFKKFNPIMMFIGFLIFGEFLDFLIKIDHWMFTLPFILGFLLQVWKLLYLRLRM